MAGFSKYLANKIYEATLAPTGTRANLTAPAVTYFSLHTAAPDDDTGGSEATFTSYARQAITNIMTVTTETSGTEKTIRATTGSSIQFPASTSGADQTVTHWGIYDALSGGNLLYSGAFDTPRTVQNGDIVVVNSAALTIDLV